MQAVKIAKQVNFDCGCISEYVLIGDQAFFPNEQGNPQKLDWHVVPCNKCAVGRQPGVLEQRAEEAWNKALSSSVGKSNLQLATR